MTAHELAKKLLAGPDHLVGLYECNAESTGLVQEVFVCADREDCPYDKSDNVYQRCKIGNPPIVFVSN